MSHITCYIDAAMADAINAIGHTSHVVRQALRAWAAREGLTLPRPPKDTRVRSSAIAPGKRCLAVPRGWYSVVLHFGKGTGRTLTVALCDYLGVPTPPPRIRGRQWPHLVAAREAEAAEAKQARVPRTPNATPAEPKRRGPTQAERRAGASRAAEKHAAKKAKQDAARAAKAAEDRAALDAFSARREAETAGVSPARVTKPEPAWLRLLDGVEA